MAPLIPLYAAGAALRLLGQSEKRLGWPVVSVGNLSVGGSGKTPFVVALAGLLVRAGMHVDVLSRGYGRQSTAVERVNPAGNAERYGDEPLLIARETEVPVYVGAQRFAAGQLAERDAEQDADGGGIRSGVHILDDGFQHRELARRVDIVLLNSEDLEDTLLPAGNLREGLHALKRASVLAVPWEDDAAFQRIEGMGLKQPVWRFKREMIAPEIPESLRSRKWIAFCGIARPAQFFAGLEKKGFKLAARSSFPDHHRFTAADVEMLRGLAERSGAGALITTAKDLVRMGEMAIGLDGARPIYAARLEVQLEDEAGAIAWLRQALGTA